MGDEKEHSIGQAVSDNSQQVGGDPYTMQDAGDMDAAAMNNRSHATQQLSEDEMASIRTAALMQISQIFTDGNSVEMARSVVGNAQSPIAGEIEALIERVKSKHGNVPETQVEADQRKAEEAQAITGALVGAPVMLATGVAAGGMLAGMFSGPKEEQYKQGAGALLADSGAAAQADSIGAFLMGSGNIMGANAISDGMSPSNVQMTHGIPAQQRSQQTVMGA